MTTEFIQRALHWADLQTPIRSTRTPQEAVQKYTKQMSEQSNLARSIGAEGEMVRGLQLKRRSYGCREMFRGFIDGTFRNTCRPDKQAVSHALEQKEGPSWIFFSGFDIGALKSIDELHLPIRIQLTQKVTS